MARIVKVELDKERSLQFNLNSLRKMEKEFGVNITKLEENFSMEMVQVMLYVGLTKEDPTVTFEEVGEMVDLDNIQEVTEKLSAALGGLKK